MARVRRPQRVLIGVDQLAESLAVIEFDHAHRLADEIDAVKRCITAGDALELAETLTTLSLPGLEEAEEAEPGDPWDWSEQPEVSDGDWPPLATSLIFKTFQPGDVELWSALGREGVGGRREFTALNGDVYTIDPSSVDELVATLASLGVAATCDDAVMARISPE